MEDKLPLETLKLELIQWVLSEQDPDILNQLMVLKAKSAAAAEYLPIRKAKRQHGFANRTIQDFDGTPPEFDDYLK